MATTESKLAALFGQALGLQQQIAAVEAEINQLISVIQADPRREGELILAANALQDRRQTLRLDLVRVNEQIAKLQADQNGRTSAGEIIRDDAQAQTQNANEVNPPSNKLLTLDNGRIRLSPDTSSGSNAQQPPTNINTGLNAPLKPLTETQSTPIGGTGVGQGLTYRVPGTETVDEDAFIGGNYTGLPLYSPPQPGGTIGVGSPRDDSSGATTNATVAALNTIDYTAKIVPQPNVLDQYASYTYQASLYLCTKENYQRMINTGQKNISGAQLLMQSGGSSIADGVRNANFDLDFYIDRIELKSFFVGKATRLAHNVKEVRMTVVEPNGITLLDRLKKAVDQFAPSLSSTVIANQTTTSKPPGAKSKNFTAQIYLLAIRFYGYDEKGNLVRAGNKLGQTSDPNAFVEKWYPLILSKFNFKVANKLTEYDLEFKAPPYMINASAKDGTIPFNIELSGGTIKDILAGPAVYGAGQDATSAAAARAAFAANDPRRVDGGSATPPPKANVANTAKSTVRQGLMDALNAHQRQLVAEGIYQYPNEYNVEFALDVMASATITNPGTNSVNKSATAMAAPTTAGEVKLGSKQSMDPNSRVEGAVAGTQIVQFIDTLLRNSSYIKDQQLLVIDENTGKERATGTQVKNTSWYKIGFKAEAKLDQYDEKRNDYAYKITYVISPYKIVQLNSPYFPQPQFNGVHKSYKYWFTGENTQILSYEESLNSLYYVVMSGSDLGGVSSSADSEQKFSYQTASGQASQGAEAKTLEPAANAADQLYNPGDLKSCVMTIVGDPAWLQQGEAFVGLQKGQPDYFSAFLADGTINFDSQQILFEVAYNTAGDYNLETGLMDITRGTTTSSQSNYNENTVNQQDPSKRISRVYLAKECVSEFNRGKFTQTLKGTLKLFYPNKTTTTATVKTEVKAPTAVTTGAKTQIKTPAAIPTTSVTGQTPTSSTAKGVQQLLRPPSQVNEPSLAQLQASPAYIQARRGGATPAAALDAARSAFAAGTNNYQGVAVPGIRDTSGTNPGQGSLQKFVKDGNPG